MKIFLKEIHLENFKSFKGQHIIPFSRYTSIIGPNGNGKSNIMDAIAFVVGEDISNLRINKIDDLKYSFIDEIRPIRIGVTAVFRQEKNEEVSFSRLIKNDKITYKINNEVVLCKFYLSELEKFNLNINYKNFLIYQNDVESIILSKPEDVTNLIEHLSCSVLHKTDYIKVKKSLMKVELELNSLVTKKKELISRKKYLQKQCLDAKSYDGLKMELDNIKKSFILFQLFHIREDIAHLQKNKDNTVAEVQKYRIELQQIIDKESSQKQCNKKNISMLLKLEKNKADLELEKGEINKKLILLQEEIEYALKKKHLAEKSLKEAQDTKMKHNEIIQDLQNSLQDLNNLKMISETNICSPLDSQSSNNQQVATYYNLKTKVNHKFSENKQFNLYNNKLKSDNDKLDCLLREKCKLIDEFKLLKSKKEVEEERKNKLLKTIKQTEIELSEIKAETKSFERETDKIENSISSLRLELDNINEQINDVKIDRILYSKKQMKNEHINALKNNFSEVYGRVSDLCKPIHERYNIAIAKIFGKYFDAIIVKTMETAKKCINYLRVQKLGVETFLSLDSLQVKSIKESLRNDIIKEDIKFAYDIIKFSPSEIGLAISFITKDIVVCDKMEEAQKLALNKIDAVSLDGTLFRQSGIFSGGAVTASKSAMKWSEEKVIQLKLKQENVRKLLRDSLLKLNEFSNKTTDDHKEKILQARLKYEKESLQKIENEITSLNDEINKKSNLLLQKSEECSEIEKNINEITSELANIKIAMETYENEIFKNFCKQVGVNNIREYEEKKWLNYCENEKKLFEINNQFDQIENQLNYELQRNNDFNIDRWKNVSDKYNESLKNLYVQKQIEIEKLDKCKKSIGKLEKKLNEIKVNSDVIKKEICEYKKQIAIISNKISILENNIITLSSKITDMISAEQNIVKTAKVEGIDIPITGSQNSNSTPGTDSCCHFSINFNSLPDNYLSRNVETIQKLSDQLKNTVSELENKIKELGTPEFNADMQLEQLVDSIKKTNKDVELLQKNVKEIKRKFGEIQTQRSDKFLKCLGKISLEIETIYKELVQDNSAQACLIPKNPEEPYLDGIIFSCIAPGKRFLSISEMSGGEKTLAALSLIFAMSRYRDTPFIIMDEIDAALDNVNIKNVLRFVHSNKDYLQFIIISLKEEFLQGVDYLIGVYRNKSVQYSEVVTLNLNEYEHQIEE